MDLQSYSPHTNSQIINEYDNLLTNSYKNSLGGNIVFATVYKISQEKSSVGDSSEAFLEKVGERSTVKYTKINKFPLFNFQAIQPELNWDFDTGYRSGKTTTSCSIMPTNIELFNGDLIELDVLNDITIFEIEDDISESHITNKKFKNIKLSATDYSSDDLILQMIDELTYNFEKDEFVKTNDISVLDIIVSEEKRFFNNVVLSCMNAHQRVFKTKLGESEELINIILADTFFPMVNVAKVRLFNKKLGLNSSFFNTPWYSNISLRTLVQNIIIHKVTDLSTLESVISDYNNDANVDDFSRPIIDLLFELIKSVKIGDSIQQADNLLFNLIQEKDHQLTSDDINRVKTLLSFTTDLSSIDTLLFSINDRNIVNTGTLIEEILREPSQVITNIDDSTIINISDCLFKSTLFKKDTNSITGYLDSFTSYIDNLQDLNDGLTFEITLMLCMSFTYINHYKKLEYDDSTKAIRRRF